MTNHLAPIEVRQNFPVSIVERRSDYIDEWNEVARCYNERAAVDMAVALMGRWAGVRIIVESRRVDEEPTRKVILEISQ